MRGVKPVIDRFLDHLPNLRTETVGDTVYCYTHDAKPVMNRLKDMPGLVFLHRPATLEDVFLKLTGRELRD